MTHLFAYAQMLSIREQVFRADSTFPRETYSPACNFTRSFFLSKSNYTNSQSGQSNANCMHMCGLGHAGSHVIMYECRLLKNAKKKKCCNIQLMMCTHQLSAGSRQDEPLQCHQCRTTSDRLCPQNSPGLSAPACNNPR